MSRLVKRTQQIVTDEDAVVRALHRLGVPVDVAQLELSQVDARFKGMPKRRLEGLLGAHGYYSVRNPNDQRDGRFAVFNGHSTVFFVRRSTFTKAYGRATAIAQKLWPKE